MLKRIILFFISISLIASCGNSDDSTNEETITLNIESFKTPCIAVSQMLCSVTDDDDHFYDPIDGFNFVWGHNYQLLLQVTKVNDPSADGSSNNYTLIQIISEIEDAVGAKYEYKLLELLERTLIKNSDVYYFLGQPFICSVEVDCNELVSLNNTGGLVNVIFEYAGNGKIILIDWN